MHPYAWLWWRLSDELREYCSELAKATDSIVFFTIDRDGKLCPAFLPRSAIVKG